MGNANPGYHWVFRPNVSAASRLVCLALLLVVPGCWGRQGPERVAVHGTVTRAGEPVQQGSVRLLPDKGHHGPAAFTAIEQGRYEFSRDDGPVAGPHRLVVSIEADGKTQLMADPAAGPGAKGGAQTAPGKWEFQVEVPKQESFEHNVELD